MKFKPADDWREQLDPHVDELLDTDIGEPVLEDARRYCPKDTGALAESGEKHLEDHTLVISFSGNEDRAYGAYVELGHRIVAWGHDTGRQQPPKPYMRPALYQRRGGA